MKRIEIEYLELTQFQKFEHYKIEFSPSVTNITGDNGSGKTTIYTAATWLLFGKDAYDRKVFDVRHKIDGEINYEADTVVVGKFKINNDGVCNTHTLRKVLHSEKDRSNVWHDSTLCYVDDVPKLVSEYNDFVSSIIPEKEFKMLTSVTYFLSMDMAAQREYLCQMAGVKAIEDVIEGNKALVDVYSKKPQQMSLEDFIKTSQESLKRLKEEQKTIQPSINALIDSKPEERNWLELEEKKKDVQKEINSIKEQLSSLDESIRAKVDERTEIFVKKENISNKIKSIDKACEEEISIIEKEAEKKYLSEKEAYDSSIRKYSTLEEEIRLIKAQIEADKSMVNRLSTEMDELMESYNRENDIDFSITCPLLEKRCNEMREEDIDVLREKFNEKKKKKIDTILTEGRKKKVLYDATQRSVEEKIELLATKETSFKNLQSQISSIIVPIKQTIDKTVYYEKYKKEKASLEEEYKKLDKEYNSFTIERNDAELKANHDEKIKELESVIKELSLKAHIGLIETQVESLRQKGTCVADKIVEQTNLVDSLNQINRMVVEDAATRINSLFQITHWEMSEKQKNGAYKDICKPTVNGISASLNTATRINIGIDIIQVISDYKGIQVPLFLDNRESINTIVDTKMQLINLSVAPKGTPLTIS